IKGLKLMNIREAWRRRDEICGVDKSTVPQNREISVGKAFDAWLERAKLKKSSKKAYRSKGDNHISAQFKRLKVYKVSPGRIEREYEIAKAESLAPNTIYQLHNAVASFFDSCTREAVDLDGNLVPHYRNDNPVAQMNEDDIPQKPDRT